MKKRTQNIAIISSCLMMVTSMTLAPHVAAEAIVITGNGEGSSSTVNTSTNNNTTVQQNNEADINNDINTQAETGNNEANGNTGDNVAIETGDASANTTVSTEANTSHVSQEACCQTQTITTKISGNGSHSNNTVNKATHNNTDVTINQNANITNNVYQNLSTGNNKANYNVGDVTIQTGDINSEIRIINAPVNVAKVKVTNSLEDFLIKISNNGYGSYNNVDVDVENDQDITTNNAADIINDLVVRFETGGNEGNDNVGDVEIKTGAIESLVEIINSINVSEVEAGCDNCKEEDKENEKPEKPGDKPEKPQDEEKAPPPSKVSGGNGGAAPTSDHEDKSYGEELPVTGGNWLMLALFGNIMMLLLGAYLRLRSGRSPGVAAAL